MSQKEQIIRYALFESVHDTLRAIGPTATLQALDSAIDFIGRTPRESLAEDEFPPTLRSIPCAAMLAE